MPEPLVYLQATGAAAIVSALVVMTMLAIGRSASTTWLNSTTWRNWACVLAMGLGLAVGYDGLSLRLAWPPSNGLDRLLTIVLPAALAVELLAGLQSTPRSVAWLMRMVLAASMPRILLHGSVYLSGSDNWAPWQVGTAMLVCGGLLASLWILLFRLSQRSPGVSIPLALNLTTLCAGLSVMMAGYIKGGAASFPLVAALFATTLGAKLIAKCRFVPGSVPTPANFDVSTILGIGVVGLFGLLFVGRFFGQISTGCALTILLAPLLCWATEVPLLRHLKPWMVGSLRLALVAIPLVVVLTLAKRDFDREMSPLLGNVKAFTGHRFVQVEGHASTRTRPPTTGRKSGERPGEYALSKKRWPRSTHS